MKTLLRIAAAMSFLFLFGCGLGLLLAGISSKHSDGWAVIVIGCFFAGNAFFAGPMLLVAAEKFDRNDGNK